MTSLKPGFITLALVLLPCAIRAAPQNAVNDTVLGASITYEVGAANTSFAAVTPKGWFFQVLVDGNEDGKWGTAAYSGQALPSMTADFAYGIDSDTYFCSQYIIGWLPADPGRVGLYTDCDGKPSRGFFQASAIDSQKRVTTTFTVPNPELFGSRKEVSVVLDIWDKKQLHYYFTLSAPLVIHR